MSDDESVKVECTYPHYPAERGTALVRCAHLGDAIIEERYADGTTSTELYYILGWRIGREKPSRMIWTSDLTKREAMWEQAQEELRWTYDGEQSWVC